MSNRRLFTRFAISAPRRTAVVLATAGLLFPCGCDVGQLIQGLCGPRTDVGANGAFVGAVAQIGAMMSLDFTRCPDGDHVRAFVTDGTAAGTSEYFEGAVTNDEFGLFSASGHARIDGRVTLGSAEGTITLTDGAPHTFTAVPAVDGAGLYEVAVDADGAWNGTGSGGATLEAQQDGNIVVGVITDATGRQYEYGARDLSRIFAEPVTGGEPDNYLLVVLPHGDAQIGRGGAESLKTGHANVSANFIHLDLPGSDSTPGTFVGRFQNLPDLIGFEFDQPDISGNRHVRIFVCDGQPAPDGRAEWFSGDFAGEFPDASFALDSLSGAARITNLEQKIPQGPSKRNRRALLRHCDGNCGPYYCPCGIAGTLELADGTRHAFYAVPAGEGAGIYEVKLEPGRMHGTSIQGGTLDLHIDGGRVTGTITAPDGTAIDYQAEDLGQAFSDPATLASVPDTFVVLVAPRGRFLVGSPGNVHGLVVIAIIAVLIGILVPAVQRAR